MMALVRLCWRPLLVLAVIAGIWLHGRHTGREAARTAYELTAAKALAAQVDAINDLAAAEQRNRLLSIELEDAARADPPSAVACLPVGRVLRLNRR